MKKMRARIIALMMAIIGISCTISVCITIMSMNGFFEDKTIKTMFMGMAFRDFVLLMLLLATVFIYVWLVTHSATSPLEDIRYALKKIADGDYDIRLEIQEKGKDFTALEEDFNAMVQQLRSNEYLHKDFSSNISHEFKTPLSIIKGYADLLAAGDISEEDREYAKLISEESGKLSTLTANMLRLSSIEQSNVHLKRAPFSLDEQIRQAAISMESKWIGKNIDVDLDLEDVMLNGDEELMNQVWLNLLDNAVKFTGAGGRITVSLGIDKGEVVASIEDSGIGMDSETMDHIFRQFYRGDTAKQYEGSGLGLSLVQRIVQMHDGNIFVESVEGRGSNFTVTLPISKN